MFTLVNRNAGMAASAVMCAAIHSVTLWQCSQVNATTRRHGIVSFVMSRFNYTGSCHWIDCWFTTTAEVRSPVKASPNSVHYTPICCNSVNANPWNNAGMETNEKECELFHSSHSVYKQEARLLPVMLTRPEHPRPRPRLLPSQCKGLRWNMK